MSADYRFSLQRPTQRFGSLGIAPSVLRTVGLNPSLLTGSALALNANLRVNLAQMLQEASLDIWTRDAEYASSATFVDYRQENCCSIAGGMRCRVPYMTFQMWNLGVPCNSNSMGRFLFPLDRFVWAQNELRRLLSALPGQSQLGISAISMGPIPERVTNTDLLVRCRSGNQRIAVDPAGWAQWCVKVMRCVALLRWSTNLRWSLVETNGTLTPNVHSLTFQMNKFAYLDERGLEPRSIDALRARAARMFTDPTAPTSQFLINEEVARNLSVGGSSLIDLAPNTWDYNQLGGRDNAYGVYEGPLSAFPLDRVKIPVNKSEFDPVPGLFWTDDNLYYAPLPRELRGATSAEELLRRHFEIAGLVPVEQLDRLKWAFTFPAPQYVYGGGTETRDVTAWLPSPYAQVLYCAMLAQDALAFDYLTFINKTLETWLAWYETLPEQFRMLDVASMRDAMSSMLRAQTDAAAAIIGGVGGTVAGIAAAINPIAGIVVSVLVAIATLLVQLAQELCIVLPENPPWVSSPFIRFIDTGEDMQGACDFETTGAGGAAAFRVKADLIRGMAERGITPDQWFDTLNTLTDPQMTGDGRGEESSMLLPLLGASAAVLLLLAAARKKQRERLAP